MKMTRQKNEGSLKGNWISAFSLCLVLLILAAARVSFSKDAVRLYFFYSNESGGQKVEEEFIKPLSKKYPIEIQSFSLNELNNYDLLDKFEKELKQEGNELPAVIIGDKILAGEERIRRDLEELIRSYAEKGGSPWPSLQVTKAERWIPHAPTEKEKDSRKIIYGAFFYTPGCHDCEEKTAKLKEWVSHFPDLRIGLFDLTEEENKKIEEALAMTRGVPESERTMNLALYIGKDHVSSDGFRYEIFQSIVSKYEGKGSPPPWQNIAPDALKTGQQRMIERFKRISLPGVLIAGLIDGVNPCAFATLIFLVSYLTLMGREKKEILLYGILFTLGVFVAYFLAGIGLMAGLRRLSSFPLVAKTVYLIIALITLSLAIVSLYDYVLFRRGRAAEWKLQLPMALKRKVHAMIREGVRSKTGPLATFALGFVVSGVEVICTGQVYVPTIGSMMAVPQMRVHALLYLLLYNVMFTAPLVGIFVAAYFGVTSERLGFLAKRHMGAVKLSTAILFFALAGILILLRVNA